MEKKYDVVVVGGGPIGGHIATLIAKRGYKVLVTEEHGEVGKPMECAGIFSTKALDIVDVDCGGTVLNRIRGAEVYSPGGKKITITAKDDRAVVVDRTSFDKRIVMHAVKSGAELALNSRVVDSTLKNGSVLTTVMRDGEKVAVRSKLIIGADGVKSGVAKWFNLPRAPVLLPGFEAEMENVKCDNDKVKIFVGNGIAPGFFAWIIPTNDIARVGLCTKINTRKHFENLLSSDITKNFLGQAKALRFMGGVLPLGMLERTYGTRVMIAGDAACQVKATSGGGIYPGLVCATHCANVAVDALAKNDLSERFLARYHKKWMAELGRELKRDWLLHRIFQTFDDRKIEEAFELLDNPRILKLLEKKGDIDYPSKLVLPVLRIEPGFLKFTTTTVKDFLLGKE